MKLQTLLGKQATDADIEEIKAEFHPSNTANVNIVPYEIYDEDGEEIVVGEVRKTIDGVKKRKPVYKKTMINVAVNTTILTNVEDMLHWYYLRLYSSATSTDYVIADGSYETNWVVVKNNNGTVSIPSASGSYSAGAIKVVVVKYTKTSDEWTAI